MPEVYPGPRRNQPLPSDWTDPEFISGGARHALKIYSRRSLVAFLVLLVGIGYAIHESNTSSTSGRTAIVNSGRALAVDSCNRDFQSIGRQRGLLERAKAQTTKALKKGQVSREQADDAYKFYADELARIPLPDCRKAKLILTDDPKKPIKQPVPLHP